MRFTGRREGVPVLPGENPNSHGKTKEALVGVVYTVNPHIRSAEEVAYSMTNSELLTEGQRDHLRARNINYQASVEKSKEEVFESLRTEVDQRSNGSKKIICLFDGAHVLWRLVPYQ